MENGSRTPQSRSIEPPVISPVLKPVFSFRKAKKLIGKRVIIGYTYLAPDASVERQEQKYGIITSVRAFNGITVLEHGTAKTINLPADLRGWKRADKATYLLHSSGEHVKNPDYLTSWIIDSAGSTPRPHVKQRIVSSASMSIYGIGTSLYGHSDSQGDGSYIVTKWFIVLMLPVYPLASFRIRAHSRQMTFGLGDSRIHTSAQVPRHTSQIIRTYLITYSIIAVILIAANIAAASSR
jgi:hypothetical protein